VTDQPRDDAGQHWDLQALARFDQGDVADDDRAAMSAHVERCDSCTRRLGQIRTTRALLSALPAEPMPPGVADRIDAAVAGAGTGPLAATVVPNQPRRSRGPRRWFRSPAFAGSAAAVAVLVLVGAIVTATVLRHQHTNNSASAGSAAGTQASGAADARAIKEWQTGSNYTPATIASLVPPLLTGTPPSTLGSQALSLSPAAPKAAAVTPTPSAAPATPAFGATTAHAPAITFAQMQASRDAVLNCGKMLAAGGADTPLAVDFARFDGQPAVVIVLPTDGHTETVDVWVVRSVCSDEAIDLYFHRVARTG
jgi:hypothetical protein